MAISKAKVFYALIFIISIQIIYQYGRSLYMPIINKVKTHETVESINGNLSDQVYARLENNLSNIGLIEYPKKISILAFKEEEKLEVWAYVNSGYQLLKSYPFTATSGALGPKLKQGDLQIPEGIYNIEYLNPNSSYYLSLKVSYPNKYEKKKATEDYRTDIGDNIFIHGKDVTVGCIPIGDKAVEEVFTMASQVNHEDIEVIISPRDFRINPEYPEIDHVAWSDELYDIINQKLKQYSKYRP